MAEFVSLSAEQLPRLMEKLKQCIPDTLPIFYTADNVIRGRLSLDHVHFYVDVWPGPSCIALVSPAHCGQLFNYRTTVDVWSEDSASVVRFLKDNTVLDWNQPIFFRVQHLDEPELKAVCETLEEKQGTYNCVERHIYVLDSPPLERTPPPEGYTLLKQLSSDDAKTVGLQYTAWGVEPSDTIRYFQKCAALLPSSGIRTENGQLISYAVLHHTSALGSVVTDPEHQRRGLGRTVVTDLCWKMKEDGQVPYVYVNPSNTASAKLYEKCGFHFKAEAYRIRYVPRK